jgi:hypothetical protein
MVWVKKKADNEKISDEAAQVMLDNGYTEVFILAKKDEAHIDDDADSAYLWYARGSSYSAIQLAKFALLAGLKWMDLKLQLYCIGKLTTEVVKLLNKGITVEQIQEASRAVEGMNCDLIDLDPDDEPEKMN